jgi:hypothetical protein
MTPDQLDAIVRVGENLGVEFNGESSRARLQRLVEAGLVESRGERRGRIWHLLAPFGGHLSPTWSKSCLRPTARLRATPARADGLAVRGKARADHPG